MHTQTGCTQTGCIRPGPVLPPRRTHHDDLRQHQWCRGTRIAPRDHPDYNGELESHPTVPRPGRATGTHRTTLHGCPTGGDPLGWSQPRLRIRHRPILQADIVTDLQTPTPDTDSSLQVNTFSDPQSDNDPNPSLVSLVPVLSLTPTTVPIPSQTPTSTSSQTYRVFCPIRSRCGDRGRGTTEGPGPHSNSGPLFPVSLLSRTLRTMVRPDPGRQGYRYRLLGSVGLHRSHTPK